MHSNPLSSWFASFRENFRVTHRWFPDLAVTAGAALYKFVGKAPTRILRLLEHVVSGLAGLFTWLAVDGPRAVVKSRNRQADALAKGAPIEAEGESPGDPDIGAWLRRGLLNFLAWLGRLVAKLIDLLGIGELVDLITMVLKINTRSLSAVEIAEARKVFGDSLSYWRVRIDEWSLIAHIGKWAAERRFGQHIEHMAVTVFNTIHFSRRIRPQPGNADMQWLIHELTHACQNEHIGSQIMGEAVYAQGAEGYDYGGPEALKLRDFKSFNREQQGDIARDYYRNLTGKLVLSDEQRVEYERVMSQLRQRHI